MSGLTFEGEDVCWEEGWEKAEKSGIELEGGA